ncbi:M56 family metallopeptidase, partial [Zunongwangia atlantica]
FVEKEAFRSKSIPQEILEHEEAHVRQKHTLDLLILEVLQIIFWFNPLFIFIKKSMRLNHEFLADEAVLKQNFSPLAYSNLLLESSINSHQNGITSSFKQSLIKKRILMISNSFSGKRIGLKMGLLLPVICCCVYFFNNDIVAKPIPLENQKSKAILDKNPVIFFTVTNTQIAINNKEVLLNDFTKKFDEATKDFSNYELLKAYIKFESKDVPKDFQEKFENEFFKTRYYKLLREMGRGSSTLFPTKAGEVNNTPAFQVRANLSENRANEPKIYNHRETPTQKMLDVWNSNSKDMQFFLDDKMISYSELKSINLKSILSYSEQFSETGSIIKMFTEINDYFDKQPPVDFQNPEALKGIQDIFINGQKVSKEDLKAYKASDFKAYRIFQDGKKKASSKFQLHFYTNKANEGREQKLKEIEKNSENGFFVQ